MTLILKIIAWLLTAAVTFATLGPARLRPHSSLGYLTPTEFRAKHMTTQNQIGAAVL